MSLRDWLAEGRLRPHRTSAREVEDLLRVVDRDLRDAAIGAISADRRFATAYNAALQTATVVVRAAGYRPAGVGHHWLTFQTLAEIMGRGEQGRVDYLDSCRRKRNVADYDAAGKVSEAEVDELLREARLFLQNVMQWIRDTHPELIPAGD